MPAIRLDAALRALLREPTWWLRLWQAARFAYRLLTGSAELLSYEPSPASRRPSAPPSYRPWDVSVPRFTVPVVRAPPSLA